MGCETRSVTEEVETAAYSIGSLLSQTSFPSVFSVERKPTQTWELYRGLSALMEETVRPLSPKRPHLHHESFDEIKPRLPADFDLFFLCVESTEIDLTEFQEENQEDGDIGGTGEAQPNGDGAGAGADAVTMTQVMGIQVLLLMKNSVVSVDFRLPRAALPFSKLKWENTDMQISRDADELERSTERR